MENCTGSRCKYCDRQCSKRCGGCQRVYYCTLICQKLDWPSHKTGCLRGSTDKMDSKEEVCQKLNHENQSHFSPDQDTRPNSNSGRNEKKEDKNKCTKCSLPNCSKSCSRCKKAFYCSKDCQRGDWPDHKETCMKELTEEQKDIYKAYMEKRKQNEYFKRLSMDSADRSLDRRYELIPLKQALIIATRPQGSLNLALLLTGLSFPCHYIVSDFDGLSVQPFPFLPFLIQFNRGYVLLAFIYRFHENAIRHGVYLKDAKDKKTKVEFYLDHLRDNPAPYFNYSQVKPGAYICLVDPVLELTEDGTFGICVNDPRRVKVLNI